MNVLIVDDQINVLDGIAAGVHFDELIRLCSRSWNAATIPASS